MNYTFMLVMDLRPGMTVLDMPEDKTIDAIKPKAESNQYRQVTHVSYTVMFTDGTSRHFENGRQYMHVQTTHRPGYDLQVYDQREPIRDPAYTWEAKELYRQLLRRYRHRE